MPGIKNVTIKIPSLSENIRIIESFIDNTKEKHQLNDDIYGNIMIAVTEAVNNAIRHGNKNVSSKNVIITLSLEIGVIRFLICDEGEGFDFRQLPDPTSPENVSKPGGRGIFLMKHLADEVDFRENGRSVQLSFYINP